VNAVLFTWHCQATGSALRGDWIQVFGKSGTGIPSKPLRFSHALMSIWICDCDDITMRISQESVVEAPRENHFPVYCQFSGILTSFSVLLNHPVTNHFVVIHLFAINNNFVAIHFVVIH
jgi:hypothetical protein